ncbi:hypothetical protein TGFOU_405460 [Toxoplasma gondii FOU]|uniref:Uncharacterized protein n=1 Tax=Toxoplasma gondii FOU TaxID=943167 RepID=A0A086KC72_TOXGO|nr:hypothetical protein TGFOU_405460 [Toxoplasma gondii FOU]
MRTQDEEKDRKTNATRREAGLPERRKKKEKVGRTGSSFVADLCWSSLSLEALCLSSFSSTNLFDSAVSPLADRPLSFSTDLCRRLVHACFVFLALCDTPVPPRFLPLGRRSLLLASFSCSFLALFLARSVGAEPWFVSNARRRFRSLNASARRRPFPFCRDL